VDNPYASGGDVTVHMLYLWFVLLMIVGCDEKHPKPVEGPPPTVEVATPVARKVTAPRAALWLTLPALELRVRRVVTLPPIPRLPSESVMPTVAPLVSTMLFVNVFPALFKATVPVPTFTVIVPPTLSGALFVTLAALPFPRLRVVTPNVFEF